MAIILDTRFNPFTYDEMVKPVQAATEAHQALEAEYGNLATEANKWKGMADEQKDPYTYKMLMSYSNDLEEKAGQLAREGLNTLSRRGMLDMKARYNQDIAPIEAAVKRREDLAKEQRVAYANNPTLMYQRDASSISLDDYIANPTLDYGHSYSGSLLTSQVADIASSLKDALTGRGDLNNAGLRFQYERLLQYGYTPDQIRQAIQNPSEGDPILTAIVDGVLESSGMSKWASPEQMRRAREFANQGLYKAIGKTDIQAYKDEAGLKAYESALAEQRAINAENRAIARAKREKKEEENDRMAKFLQAYRNNTTELFSPSDVAKQNQTINDDLEEFREKGYLTKDGELTNAGWRAIKYQLKYERGMQDNPEAYKKSGASPGFRERNEKFTRWAIQNGLKVKGIERKQVISNNSMYSYTEPELLGYGEMAAKYRQTRNRIDNGELATGVANIKTLRVRVSSVDKQQDNLIDLITSTNSPIYKVDKLKDNGALTEGESLTPEEFKKLFQKDSSKPNSKPLVIKHIINNAVGDQQLIELSNGDKYFIPITIFGEGVVSRHKNGDLNITNRAIVEAEAILDDPNSTEEQKAKAAFNLGLLGHNASAYLSSLLDNTVGDDMNMHGSMVEEELY